MTLAFDRRSEQRWRKQGQFKERAWTVCERKVGYRTKTIARAVIRRMRDQGLDRDRLLEAYDCFFCSCWHVGKRTGAPWES